VVRVAQLDPLHIEVIVPVEQLGQVRPGMRARVWAEAVGDDTWEATVSRVDRVADVASGTYGVRLSLPNPDYRIPAGLRCQMSWLAEAAAPVAVVDQKPHIKTAAAVTDGSAGTGLETVSDDVTLSTGAAVPTQVAVRNQAEVSPETVALAVEAPAVVVEVPQVSAEPELALPVCRTAGPFEDAEVARQQAKALRAQGLDVALESHPVPVHRGYQVVSEPLTDRAAADRMIERLKAAGIHDYYLMARARPLKIALGRYRSKSYAADLADRLKVRGFDVRIDPWREDSDRAFLAIRGAFDETVDAALEVLPKPGSGMVPANSLCERLAGR
jgi:hypothetical protein